MAPAESGHGLSRPCFPVAVRAESPGESASPSSSCFSLHCASPQASRGKRLNSGPGPKQPNKEQAVLCGPCREFWEVLLSLVHGLLGPCLLEGPPGLRQPGRQGECLESEARRESGVNRSPTSAGCNAQSSGALHDSFEGAPSILLPGEAGTLTGNLT